MSSVVNQLDVSALVEMGFSRERVTEALKATKDQGIPPALEWLFSHPIAEHTSGNRLGGESTESNSTVSDTDPPVSNDDASPTLTENGDADIKMESNEEQETPTKAAMSLKCDDCGKQIKSEIDAQAHAARTGHQNFAESTEAIKPLTEEEKAAQKARLQQIIEEKRKRRKEEEEQQNRNREISRRKIGKEVTQAKEDHAYQEMKKIAEERRREKIEEKRLKQKLKEQIAKDRADFKAKNQASPVASKEQIAPPTVSVPANVVKKEYDSCRIQFRLFDGKTMNSTFKADDTLQIVHIYIAENRTDGSLESFTLSTTFPRKTFQVEDMTKTLKELKLVPSSVLVLGKTQ